MLRGQSIAHRQHRTRRALTKLAAHTVVRVEAADNKTTTMEIHQHRHRRDRSIGSIQTQCQRRTIACQRVYFADQQVLRCRPAQLRSGLFESRAGFVRGHLVHGRQAGVLAVLGQIEEGFQIRV
ncbi:hypothetical protein D3C72_352240 [compost metagenome]